jgi:hypothetical protein
MTDADRVQEREVVVPGDGEELLADERRGGERVRVRAVGPGEVGASARRVGGDADPAFFGSVRTDEHDVAARSKSILRR